ncbi:LemA family protein [Hyphobacterium sp. CCMP332]|nr:LemA family protein [Hyphobacterium sp. CCMP332]
MKRSWIIIGVVVLVLIIAYSSIKGTYNSMVGKDESVSAQWANVETQYQRRLDLIPNLVNTVKGFAEQEKDVLVGVTEARANASSIKIDPSNAADLQKFQAAQGQLNSALSRLLVTVERYPDLKSNQNFLELQAQLEGTENRISVERKRFNETVRDYNTYIRQFPNNIYAGFFDFDKRPMFEADEGAESAPKVEF